MYIGEKHIELNNIRVMRHNLLFFFLNDSNPNKNEYLSNLLISIMKNN